MVPNTRDVLTRQLDIGWKLMSLHLTELTTAECLWQPAKAGLHVRLRDGAWHADWPDREDYAIGPPSIAWVTWHVGYWWSMVLDHSFGPGTLSREQVVWPGDADAVRTWLQALHERWKRNLETLTEDDLASEQRTRWPYTDRPFADVVAWANVELMKNAAEVGFARFLYAVRKESSL